ncbi:hypothetical protein GW17_00050712 [Ensete ventricosum]|nr:hypothetical protein GW17_00050712 [Ensete ventricosum]
METNYFLTWLERKFLHRQTNFQLNLIRVTCEERPRVWYHINLEKFSTNRGTPR